MDGTDWVDLVLTIVGVTICFCLSGLIMYAYKRASTDANTSISKIIARWGQKVKFLWFIVTAIIAFIIGLLCGHWFWPVNLDNRVYYHQCPSCKTWYYTDNYEKSTHKVLSNSSAFYRPIGVSK